MQHDSSSEQAKQPTADHLVDMRHKLKNITRAQVAMLKDGSGRYVIVTPEKYTSRDGVVYSRVHGTLYPVNGTPEPAWIPVSQ